MILGISLIFKNRFSINKSFSFLFLFWLIYIVRLVVDLSIRDVPVFESDFYIYFYSILGTFVPMLSVAIAFKYLKDLIIIDYVILFLVLSCLAILYMIFSSGTYFTLLLAERIWVTGTEDSHIVNPIVISRDGGLLGVLSYFCITLSNFSRKKKVYLFFSFCLGILCLLIGASRGPIAGFVFVFLLINLYWLRRRRKNWYFKALYYLTIFSVIFLLMFILWKFDFYEEIAIINRFEDFSGSNFSEEARYLQWQEAFVQISESPILGERIVERFGNHSPHNIFIEVLLATGVVGSILFLIALVASFKNFYLEYKSRSLYIVFHFCFLLYIMFGLTGITIHSSPQFWILFTLTLYRPKFFNR